MPELTEYLPFHVVICMERIQPDRCFGSCQEHQQNDQQKHLGEHGGAGRSCHTKAGAPDGNGVGADGQASCRIDQEKVSDNVGCIRGQIGSQRDPRVSGRTENCGEYYRECLGREAVADDLHVALCLGNDLRSSTKPDGERMADELHAKSQQKTKHGCAHKSLGRDPAGTSIIAGAHCMGDQIGKAHA